MRHEIMLDLETFSTKNNAVIVAIGAVKMDMDVINTPSDKPFIFDEFHIIIDPVDCQRYGLHIDGGTMMWWLKQSDNARKVLTDAPGAKLADALKSFNDWVGVEAVPMWGNGSDFDNVLLRNAYDAVDARNDIGLKAPWRYYQSRCFRTLKAMAPNDLAPPTNQHAHNALEDAKWQARYLYNIMAFLKDDVPNFYPNQVRK